MYTSADLTNTNIITGYLDQSGEFVYPTARQKFDISGTGITVNPFLFDRLLAEPVTITRVAYPGPDLTVGNFGSAEITFTIWNRSGERNQIYGDFMASVYIESDHEAFAAPEGATCYAETDGNSIIYGTENGAYIDGTLIDISAGDHIIFISCQGGVHETLIYGENATYSRRSDSVWEAWDALGEEQLRFFTMQQQEYQSSLTRHWVDIHNDSGNSRPAYTWNVNTGIKTKWAKIPLGVFTITNCDYQDEAIAITAMDGVAFDRDATEFLNGLDYSQGLTIMDIGDAIANKCVIGQFGADWGGNSSSTIYTSNPFVGLTLTYREAVKYIAAYFCANAAINRFGHLRFFNQAFYNTECSYTDDGGVTTTGPVRVTPDRIVRGTRSAASFEVPTITRVDFVQSDGSVVTYGSVPSSSSGTSKIYVFPYNPLLDQSRATDLRYNVILAWFSLMPQYRPAQMSVVYADPRIDCGDRVTFPLDASGETTFSTPISMISLRWVNGCTADYSADGQREREKYTDDADYTTQVLDNLGNGNLDLVRVTDGEDETRITPDRIETSGTVKVGRTVEVGNDSSNGAVTIQQANASSADPYNLKFKSASSRYMALHGTQYSRMYDSGTSGTAPATSGSVNNTTRTSNGYYASNNTSFSAATKGSSMTQEDGFVAKDGSEVVTHNSNGLSWEHATGAPSSLRMYTLSHTSTVTAETTYTIDLPYGTYLFLHSRQTIAAAASTGMQLVIIGQSVGSSAIIKTTAESGAQIGATSGTRSQVEISNTRQGSTSDSQDRIATVTWTVQGLSFRRLVMVRLM